MADREKPGTGGPGPLDAATAFLGAARNTEGNLRAYYTARARAEIEQLEGEVASLRINLNAVEATLGGKEHT